MPGVSAHPGCMAWTTTPAGSSRRAHSPESTIWARFTRAYVTVPS